MVHVEFRQLDFIRKVKKPQPTISVSSLWNVFVLVIDFTFDL
jgi:hypothetical protein